MLDSQLRRDAGLTHFEYFVLAMLSEAPERTLRMTTLAQRTNATLPRLSHVVTPAGERGLVERFPCPEDGRATNARLTRRAGTPSSPPRPGTSRPCATRLDPLTPAQLEQLRSIGDALLTRLDPDGRLTALYDPESDSRRMPPEDRLISQGGVRADPTVREQWWRGT